MQKEMISLGPAGIGSFKDIEKTFLEYKKLGIKCAEIPFTYQAWLSNEQAEKVGLEAEKNGIELSIHAQYWINLNSEEEKKVKDSVKRILDCCERAHYCKAKYVVFHAAYYMKKTPEEVYEIVKKKILEMQEIIKKNKWHVSLAPETTGKRSQFGTLKELLKLAKETGCFFTVDFAHIEARQGKENYPEVLQELEENGIKKIHCHFSGIEYSEKGERRHVITPSDKIKKLLTAIEKSKIQANVINEAPSPVQDSIKSLKILHNL
jgi:deoxyribonuclease-4